MSKKIKKQQIKKNLDNSRPQRPEVPEWLDCAWRRIPCGKENCPICSRINEVMGQNDENDILPTKILTHIGKDLKETIDMIKQDINKHKIELENISTQQRKKPPRPFEFPLYHKINNWRAGIYEIVEKSDEVSSAWLSVDAGEDVLWYANTILAKVYRQLCNRWRIAHNDDYVLFDYEYTRYVLDECFLILKASLKRLIDMEVTQKNEFNIALLLLTSLEREVKKI